MADLNPQRGAESVKISQQNAPPRDAPWQGKAFNLLGGLACKESQSVLPPMTEIAIHAAGPKRHPRAQRKVFDLVHASHPCAFANAAMSVSCRTNAQSSSIFPHVQLGPEKLFPPHAGQLYVCSATTLTLRAILRRSSSARHAHGGTS